MTSRRHSAASCGSIVRIAACLLALTAATSRADRDALPRDFSLPPVTFGGAGGGTSRADAENLARYPVIMVPDLLRDHRDWTGVNTGETASEDGDVYAALIRTGFQPVELWMIDFAPAGEHMTSIEEATDDLKFFITAVMQYTGSDRVQLLAHGSGGLLARLTLLKYNIAHWVASEVYIDTPFHGLRSGNGPEQTLAGDPNAWALAPGSDLLNEILAHGETPAYPDPVLGVPFGVPTLTIGAANGSDTSLRGAHNILLPKLNHDVLRCAPEAVAAYASFLDRAAQPLDPELDDDRDGFKELKSGGPDFDDDDPLVYPGAPEIEGDGIDQDCNGCDLSPERGRDGEIPLPPIASRDVHASRRLPMILTLAALCLLAAWAIREARRNR